MMGDADGGSILWKDKPSKLSRPSGSYFKNGNLSPFVISNEQLGGGGGSRGLCDE